MALWGELEPSLSHIEAFGQKIIGTGALQKTCSQMDAEIESIQATLGDLIHNPGGQELMTWVKGLKFPL